MLHILRSLIKDPDGRWRAACSCGNQSFDPSKIEAVNLHRKHIAEERTDAARAARFMMAEALHTAEEFGR